jgi:hyperosmotically inducible protein
MRTKNFLSLAAGLALAALAVGCSGDTNTNTTNTTNTNTAVVTNTNTSTKANTNANSNANKAPTKEDVEKNKETYGKQAKDAGRKIGTGASDTWLWVKAKYDLAAANDLRDSTINVDVENGVITLTGTVASKEQMQKADQIAKAVEGQKGVQNKLKVAAGNSNSNANANKK